MNGALMEPAGDSATADLAAWLRPDRATPALTPRLVEGARRHLVHLLIADKAGVFERSSGGDGAAALADELRAAIVFEAARRRELQRVLDALAAAGVRALVFKGAALAYTLYRRPYLRPRADTDLLLSRSDLPAALEALAALGYSLDPQNRGELITGQCHLTGVDRTLTHALDVHWTVVEPKRYADRVPFEQLWMDGVAVPALGSAARMPAPADSLVMACLHRVAHHRSSPHLLWLYDIYLLVLSITDVERRRAVDRARAWGVSPVCAHSLRQTAEALGGIPFDLIAAFGEGAGADVPRAFLAPDSSQVARLLDDLRALPGVRSRLQFLREHLFPPASYIRSMYPAWPAYALPLAYLDRVVRGAPSWFRTR
jgi:hypothetical protein